jgi:hypothetical protein
MWMTCTGESLGVGVAWGRLYAEVRFNVVRLSPIHGLTCSGRYSERRHAAIVLYVDVVEIVLYIYKPA